MKNALRRLGFTAGLGVVGVLGYLASFGLLAAQVTGACPAGQWVSVVGSNIVGVACTPVLAGGLSGTSGGVLGFTGPTTAASSAALGADGVVIGGGAGATPTAIAAGTNGQLLAGVSAAAPAMVTMSGDATMTNAGAVTVTKTSGVALGVGATAPTTGGSSSTLFSSTGTINATTGLILQGLPMANMKTVAGLQMTGSASSTNFGLVYTPGTAAYLVGTATSSGSTSNVAAIDFIVPQNYIPGSNLTIGISCYYLNGSSTASVHSMTAAGYIENTTLGTQTSLTISSSGAVTCPLTTATNQTLTITGTGILPGSYLVFTLSAAVTNGAGASTEYLTGVTIN